MSTNVPQNQEDQEIDLSQIFKKIGAFFEGIATTIFKGILFIKNNILTFLLLFVIGFGLGFYLDCNHKSYESEIIVMPNFNSNDYLYSKINLLNSKIKENDTVFLKKLGFEDVNQINSVEIKPILDIYKFASSNVRNFELIKLMSEKGDLNKIVEANLTSKNYPFHAVNISTSTMITSEGLINPVLAYLNSSEYYSKIKTENRNNIEIKIKQSDLIINQIDGFLAAAQNNTRGTSNNLVYYNENSQLNNIIKTKDSLITGQGYQRIERINSDKVIKDVSIVTNLKNTKGINGKLKLILPLVLISLFLIFSIFIRFYKRQKVKFENNI
jgi:hypothetical protein